eukprot:bmy_20096T0
MKLMVLENAPLLLQKSVLKTTFHENQKTLQRFLLYCPSHSNEILECFNCIYIYLKKLKVMESEEFMLLPANQLIDIISSDELNVRSEEQVFNAVMAWVKYSIQERRPQLPQVLQHVRLPLLSPKFLVGTVGSDPLIKSDEECRDLVDEAKNYLLLPQERPLMQGPRTRPRKPIRCGEVLFAVGGWCSGDAISSVERYDPQTNEWRMVASMSKRRCGVGVSVLDDLLYAVGGHDGSSYLNSVER